MNAATKAIFLSYASQDVDAARRICDALRAAGLEVWFDQSALRGGDAWDASIRRQIKECALFVPIVSANTQAREEGYFRREWNLAVSRTLDMADDRAFLLPVVIDTTLDVNARVPEKFRDVQWTHLPGGEAAAAFAERVRRLLAGGAPPTSPPPLAPARPAPANAPAPAAPANEPPSIAVLPFVNRSNSPEDEYFSDGLADELLNVLAKIRGLRVAARSSAFTFKGKGATVAEVGRALNVATVLEGSVRKAGTRIRISVQLVKVADGYQLWSETYDRTLDDIFAVQDDIAQAVVKELRSTLLGEAANARAGDAATEAVAAAVRGRSTNPEAHRLYLQARYFIDRSTGEDTAKGIGYLRHALAVEPEFALAWAELGRAHIAQANWGWASAAEGFGRAREAVLRALALEPDLPEALTGLAWVQMMHDRDWNASLASFNRALELAPNNALVLSQASFCMANLGRFDEAIAIGQRAVSCDPLSAEAHTFLGTIYWVAGRPRESESALRKALEIAPQRAVTRTWLAIALLDQERTEEAQAEAAREPEEWGRQFATSIIHHAAGRPGESLAALRELAAKRGGEAAYQVADLYALRGEADAAFEWLERAYEQRDAGIGWTMVDPYLRSLHSDPRWPVFLAKIGLAEFAERSR
jgi:TolB-like protein/cytochrome c-type biogenesis protein CcmH/NrfG